MDGIAYADIFALIIAIFGIWYNVKWIHQILASHMVHWNAFTYIPDGLTDDVVELDDVSVK